MPYIESVPNVSEGRKKSVVEGLASLIRADQHARFLDYSSDFDHNRSVFTYVTDPQAFLPLAFQFVKKACETIPINLHEGVHPYLGAVDVFPLVPLPGVPIETCVELARALGDQVALELDLPVYFYGDAAIEPERESLVDVRRGGYAFLKEELAIGRRKPDRGPSKLHPTGGAIAIGVRKFLIAFNVNLRTCDLPFAAEVAKALREKNSGLIGVRALGVPLHSRGMVQVTVNLTDCEKTSLKQVFDFVKKRATRRGILIEGSELIGLIPKQAVFPEMASYLKLKHFTDEKILEHRLSGQEKRG